MEMMTVYRGVSLLQASLDPDRVGPPAGPQPDEVSLYGKLKQIVLSEHEMNGLHTYSRTENYATYRSAEL